MPHSKRLLLIGLLMAGIVAADQLSKEFAVRHLKGRPAITIPTSWAPNDLFRIQYAENTGAFLSLGSRLPEGIRFWTLTVLNLIILAVIGLFLAFKPGLPRATALALTLILAGGFGNIIDRLFRDGRVVDFMNLGIGYGRWSLRTGIFNIADLGIVGGLVLLVAIEFGHGWPGQKPSSVPEQR
jgi:signal peptidase II